MLKSHFNLVYDDDEPAEEEQEKEVVADEEKEVIPDRHLNKSEISVRLSMLGKTAEGDGYTYLKCKITGLKMTHIEALKGFQHIMFLDLSNNLLDINALQVIAELPYLILIQADNNRLTSAGLKQMKYLQVIIFNDNQITSVNDVYHEQLSTIEIGNNKIQRVDFDNKMETLRVLDFRDNMIADISNFDFPNLDSLYLAGNRLTTLVGLEKLLNLRVLHVRDNPIKLLNGFDEGLKKLQYINLRNCKVSTIKQIKKMRVLTGLETLVLKGCPVMGGTGEVTDDKPDDEDDPQLRIDIIAALPRIKRLNRDAVTPEERDEAKEIMMQWLEEGDKDEEEIEVEQIQEEEQSRTEDP